MPNKENIKKWLDALASGEFTQAKSSLHGGGNSRCCLGVACDVYMRETGKGAWVPNAVFDTDADLAFFDGEDSMDGILPDKVQKWLGIESNNPQTDEPKPPHPTAFDSTVASLNDHGYTFQQIRDILAKKYGIEE